MSGKNRRSCRIVTTEFGSDKKSAVLLNHFTSYLGIAGNASREKYGQISVFFRKAFLFGLFLAILSILTSFYLKLGMQYVLVLEKKEFSQSA